MNDTKKNELIKAIKEMKESGKGLKNIADKLDDCTA